jgi:hypothetical protein
MGYKINIEQMKSEYVNKVFGFLTVLDIYRSKSTILFKCKCRCGSIVEKQYNKVLSGHTKSCGCYNKSKEFSDSQRQFILDHPEITEESAEKYKLWRINNPDKVERANEKHKQWFKDNPDKVREHADKYSQWCKDNPDKIKERSNKYLQWCADNSEFIKQKGIRHSNWCKEHQDILSNAAKQRVIDYPETTYNFKNWRLSHQDEVNELNRRHSEWYKENPDKVKQISEHISLFWKTHEDRRLERNNKLKQYYATHPDIIKQMSDRSKKWCEENRDIINQNAINYSIWYHSHPDITSEMQRRRAETLQNNPEIMISISNKLRDYYHNHPELRNVLSERAKYFSRLRIDHSYLTNYKDIIHPDDYEFALNNSVTHIRTKCPLCGEYDTHLFSSVFVNKRRSLKCGRPLLCRNCFNSYSSSKPEEEISNFISTFYNGECIKNSRDIISPFELDLYYSDKKIAIEFNGDYWHSTIYKPSDYHYNKFKMCLDRGIYLISIFERDWVNSQDKVKTLLHNVFTDNYSLNTLHIDDNMCKIVLDEDHILSQSVLSEYISSSNYGHLIASVDCDLYSPIAFIKSGFTETSYTDSSYLTSAKHLVNRVGIITYELNL